MISWGSICFSVIPTVLEWGVDLLEAEAEGREELPQDNPTSGKTVRQSHIHKYNDYLIEKERQFRT